MVRNYLGNRPTLRAMHRYFKQAIGIFVWAPRAFCVPPHAALGMSRTTQILGATAQTMERFIKDLVNEVTPAGR